ncbi:OFA family MFS transporter, partial [candidate division WOR-3 bacterium]|nr:OFA family MFS transporter [candidate division WOR-3 bacterium]
MSSAVGAPPAVPKTFNRWWIVAGALLVQLCLGAVYAWSVFRDPIRDLLGIRLAEAQLPFSFVLVFFALATVLGGRLQDKLGPRVVAIAGGALLGLGMIVASLSPGIAGMVVGYGVISGIGIGFAYVCPIAAGVKWFPDKRGLISGLSVAGFGAGALIVGPLAQNLMRSIGAARQPTAELLTRLSSKLAPAFTDTLALKTALTASDSAAAVNSAGLAEAAARAAVLPLGVQPTFLYLGIAYIVIVAIGALILRNPPPGYRPAGWNPPQPAAGAPAKTDYTAGQVLATWQFWLIWLLYFCGAGTGLMMIGQTAPIGKEMAGLTPQVAAVGVSVLAIFNALGRILWGRVSDSIGRTRTLFIIYLINGLAVFSYFLIPALPFWYWVGIALVGMTFGGYLAIYPAVNADFYGTKNSGVNYGLIFTAYGFGGLSGNLLAPIVKQATNNYNLAFILSGAL